MIVEPKRHIIVTASNEIDDLQFWSTMGHHIPHCEGLQIPLRVVAVGGSLYASGGSLPIFRSKLHSYQENAVITFVILRFLCGYIEVIRRIIPLVAQSLRVTTESVVCEHHS